MEVPSTVPEGQWGMRADRGASARFPLSRKRVGVRAGLPKGRPVLRGRCTTRECLSRPFWSPLEVRTRISQERRLVRSAGDPTGGIHRAVRQRLGMQSRVPEAQRLVRRSRRAFERLPRLVGTRLGLRARLQERTPFVPGLPGANARSPQLRGKRLDLRSGLSAAGRDLRRGQEVEQLHWPWAEDLSAGGLCAPGSRHFTTDGSPRDHDPRPADHLPLRRLRPGTAARCATGS